MNRSLPRTSAGGQAAVTRLALAAMLAIGVLTLTPAKVRAQNPPAGQVQIPAEIPAVPDPTVARAPIQFFRDLMAMDAVGRERALAGKAPAHRETLLAKLSEYGAMPSEEREARLRRLHLPVLMFPLMQLAPEARSNRLDRIPESERPLVGERLAEWDRLTRNQQREVLTNRNALQYFFRPSEAPVIRNPQMLNILPPPLKAKLEGGLRNWQTLTEAQRAQLTGQFRQFFQLDPTDRERVLQRFTAQDRRSMKPTLDWLSGIPEEKRVQCLQGFGKLAQLSPSQRDLFLVNLQRWQRMTAEERQLWRRLFHQLQALPAPPQPPQLPRAAAPSTTPLTAGVP